MVLCCNLSVVAAVKTVLVALFLEIAGESGLSIRVLDAEMAESLGSVVGGGGEMTASRKEYGLSAGKVCDGGIGERL